MRFCWDRFWDHWRDPSRLIVYRARSTPKQKRDFWSWHVCVDSFCVCGGGGGGGARINLHFATLRFRVCGFNCQECVHMSDLEDSQALVAQYSKNCSNWPPIRVSTKSIGPFSWNGSFWVAFAIQFFRYKIRPPAEVFCLNFLFQSQVLFRGDESVMDVCQWVAWWYIGESLG